MTGGLLAKQLRPLGALAPGEADAYFGARLRSFAAVCVAPRLRSLPPSPAARVTWTAWSGHDQEAAGVRIDSEACAGFGVFARR